MTIKPFALIVTAVLLAAGCSQPQEQVRPPSAQDNVQVLPYTFVIPEINRKRKIRLYLPPGYEGSDKHYPVVYMQDGQNLFDDATSYAGEWRIDETLNRLANQRGLEFIVVGIDNGAEHRMKEYSPWSNPEHGEAEGKLYMEFVTEVVKPFIDSNFRTATGPQNTAIMGSSMGGLISHYAVHQYPDVFGKAGIFSPSYWYAQEVYDYTRSKPAAFSARLYLLVGTEEGEDMVTNMQRMASLVAQLGHPVENLQSKVVEGAEHNEAFWAAEFEQAILWLFAERT